MRRKDTLLSMGAVALVVVLAGCGQTSAELSSDRGPELGHVHAMGVDPEDGSLYAGTHVGLFRISGSADPTPVGDRTSDLMGFAVADGGHFLASGHPGEGESGPSDLGLIESTDAGRSWTTVSLAGEADFHTLDAAGDTVAGWSGGALMVSADGGRSWDPRGQVVIADVALNPAASTIVATTERGLARSTDGGATFTIVPGAPGAALLVDWPTVDALWVVEADGGIWLSPDGGDTWEKRGAVPGSPAALTATGQSTVYVATGEGIYGSSDSAGTFTVLASTGDHQ